MTDFPRILAALTERNVKFIVIGGTAANALGSARVTYDLDLVYARDRENIRALVAALASFKPYLRGAPEGLPFFFDEQTLVHGLNFTLVTSAGDLDLLGEVVGGGHYENLVAQTFVSRVFGHDVRVVNIEKLIELKRAAGRPKDFEAIAELELILKRTKGS